MSAEQTGKLFEVALGFGIGLWMTYMGFRPAPQSELTRDRFERFRPLFKIGGPLGMALAVAEVIFVATR